MSARAIFPGPNFADRPRCEERLYTPETKDDLTQAERDDCDRQVKDFEERQGQAAKNQFFVLMGAAVLLLVVGGFMYTVPVVSSGILWGGVVSLFYTLFFSFQPGIEDYYRLLAAIIAFILLVALAYRMFGKERLAK